ncbi:MAG TPA: 50S ribosomal protein L11 methyltransferase [Alphaproteobacteria bacterium]
MSTVEIWRIELVADAVSQATYAAALEEISASLSAFETAPGGPWRIEALLTAEPDREAVAARLAAAAASLGREAPKPIIERMPDIDWVAENRRSFPPLRVGRFFVYGSHYRGQIPAGARAITLDAGMAFGSGEHATTRGCLLALDAEAKRRRLGRALDVGCGSGILAIAMAKAWPAVRPAGIVAADIDPDSVRIARENVQRNKVAHAVRVRWSNGLNRIRVRRGYDAVVANILANPLRRLAGDISRAARPGGIVILSGLLGSQENEVRAAYRARGLVLVGRLALDGWHTLVLKRTKRGRHQTAAASL